MTMDSGEIREKLRLLGERRKQIEADEGELSTEVEEALREAYGHVSVTEAAQLLGMHRTTVYRVYAPHAV